MAETQRENRRKVWLETAVVAGLLLLFLTLSITSMRQKNATSDETMHIPAGYTYAALGDFRLNPEHPPLVKRLSGLMLLSQQPTVDLNDAAWQNRKQTTFGAKFLFEWNNADQMVFWARLPMVLLAVGLGLGIFFWARELYGWQAGYLALALYLFNPDILAHSQLVTTDLAVSAFMFFSVYAFYKAMRRLTIWNALLFAVTVGLTLVTKFSGILILPILALVGAVFVLSDKMVSQDFSKSRTVPRQLSTRREKLSAAMALLAFSVAVSFAVIWLCYGFRYQISADPAISGALDWQHYWNKSGASVAVLHAAYKLHLFPEAYTYGFLYALESMEVRFAYLLGEYSSTGWWYYFLVTFFIKTPVPLLLLILLGFVFIKRYGGGYAQEAMLLLPVGFYWLTAIFNNINIGHRHLLPIYPFLIVFAAKMARAFQPPESRRLAAVVACLLVWNITTTTLVYPHFLAYFNEIAGGPANGHRWLTDSNLDWGQDLKGLAAYQRQRPQDSLYLSYFGTASPEYYGIRAGYLLGYNRQVIQKLDAHEVIPYEQIPSGALVAISVTNLSGVHLRHFDFPGTEEFLQRLRSMQPIDNIGHSILIYRMP